MDTEKNEVMDPERKALLIKALRSGEYEQTKGCLQDPDGFCCLGVACEVYHGATGEGEWREQHTRSEVKAFHDEKGQEWDVLPSGVLDWYFTKLGRKNPRVYIDRMSDDLKKRIRQKRPKYFDYLTDPRWTTLAEMNDEGFSFDLIADVIEECF